MKVYINHSLYTDYFCLLIIKKNEGKEFSMHTRRDEGNA